MSTIAKTPRALQTSTAKVTVPTDQPAAQHSRAADLAPAQAQVLMLQSIDRLKDILTKGGLSVPGLSPGHTDTSSAAFLETIKANAKNKLGFEAAEQTPLTHALNQVAGQAQSLRAAANRFDAAAEYAQIYRTSADDSVAAAAFEELTARQSEADRTLFRAVLQEAELLADDLRQAPVSAEAEMRGRLAGLRHLVEQRLAQAQAPHQQLERSRLEQLLGALPKAPEPSQQLQRLLQTHVADRARVDAAHREALARFGPLPVSDPAIQSYISYPLEQLNRSANQLIVLGPGPLSQHLGYLSVAGSENTADEVDALKRLITETQRRRGGMPAQTPY